MEKYWTRFVCRVNKIRIISSKIISLLQINDNTYMMKEIFKIIEVSYFLQNY